MMFPTMSDLRKHIGAASVAWAIVVASWFTACSPDPEVHWKYSLTAHNGDAVWNLDGVCLVFQGQGKAPLAATGDVVIHSKAGDSAAGGGAGRGSRSAATWSEAYNKSTGIATLSFRERSIELKERGTLARVGNREFALRNKPKQTIVIPPSGEPSIRDFVAADAPPVPPGELLPDRAVQAPTR
jgi:hypothetical protein